MQIKGSSSANSERRALATATEIVGVAALVGFTQRTLEKWTSHWKASVSRHGKQDELHTGRQKTVNRDPFHTITVVPRLHWVRAGETVPLQWRSRAGVTPVHWPATGFPDGLQALIGAATSVCHLPLPRKAAMHLGPSHSQRRM